MADKRRLPVLQTAVGEDPDVPPRPAWQWVVFGALAIFVVWLPLAWITATVMTSRAEPRFAPGVQALLFGAGLVVAALAGGYLLGRWGTRAVGVREAALAGVSAGAIAATLGSMGLALPLRVLVAAVAVALASAPAALGGRLGMKKRSGAW